MSRLDERYDELVSELERTRTQLDVLVDRYQGVDLQARRPPYSAAWPRRWRGQCHSSKHAHARVCVHADTLGEVMQALFSAIECNED